MDKDWNLKGFIFEIIETLVGSFIMSIAVALFLVPNELSSGGFSGIATIIFYLFNIPVGRTIIALNIPLFCLGAFKMGKIFFIKSLVGMLSLSIFTDFLANYSAFTSDKILACVYGGILTGIGTALILRANASTGGSDLAGSIIKKFKPTLRTGNLIIIIDIIVVALNVIFLKKIEIGLYSGITIYLMGKIIDILFEGIYFTKLIFIISNKGEELAEHIGYEVQRGVTGLYGKGMYTKIEKTVLMCAVSRNDISKIKTVIKKVDPSAFFIITNSREVLGVGFKRQ